MTLALYHNKSFLADAGTNAGWNGLVTHIRTTDVERYPNAHHLVEYGWARFVQEAIEELGEILTESPPGNRATRTLLEHLVRHLAALTPEGNDTLTVTDGFV